MTLAPDFLKMLVCPATRKPLRLCSDAELQRLNDRIGKGGVLNRGGAAVVGPLSAGLVPEGEAVVYPILDGIPILLSSEAVPLDTPAATATKPG